ncbi:hypothetical protein CHUAL_003789 [Chamberlinius hualienensis]
MLSAIVMVMLAFLLTAEALAIDKNALVINKEREARTKNELTQEEIFLKSWSNYIGLWSFLIGTFVLPTVITMIINPLMGRQTRDIHEKLKNIGSEINPLMGRQTRDIHEKLKNIGNQEILHKLSAIESTWQNLDINDPMCRKRIICEVYSGQSPLGLTNKDMIQTVYHLSLRMPLLLRKLHREHSEAMSVGKQTGDCSRYFSCAYYFIGHG